MTTVSIYKNFFHSFCYLSQASAGYIVQDDSHDICVNFGPNLVKQGLHFSVPGREEREGRGGEEGELREGEGREGRGELRTKLSTS